MEIKRLEIWNAMIPRDAEKHQRHSRITTTLPNEVRSRWNYTIYTINVPGNRCDLLSQPQYPMDDIDGIGLATEGREDFKIDLTVA